MKKIMLLSATLLLVGSFAFGAGGKDAPGTPAPAPDYTSPRGMMDLEPGTQVIHEYKKLTGTLLISDRLIPALKADGVEYILMAPMKAYYAINPKNGDAASLEGLTITVKKADGKVETYLRPYKGTIAGKDVNFGKMMPGRGGDRDRDDWGPGRDGGPGMGPGMMGPGPGNRN